VSAEAGVRPILPDETTLQDRFKNYSCRTTPRVLQLSELKKTTTVLSWMPLQFTALWVFATSGDFSQQIRLIRSELRLGDGVDCVILQQSQAASQELSHCFPARLLRTSCGMMFASSKEAHLDKPISQKRAAPSDPIEENKQRKEGKNKENVLLGFAVADSC
jgi:hypothetical protein